MNIGTRVSINEWVVNDQTNGKSTCTTGVVVSDVTTEKAYGYKDQYNHYIKVKLDDGITESFNLHELNKDSPISPPLLFCKSYNLPNRSG